MKKHSRKPVKTPSPAAKALSLFLMAYKSKDLKYKEELKRINKRWDLYQLGELNEKDYSREVDTMLKDHGGYESVVEKTVRYYIEKTGAWTLTGDTQYHKDAQAVADKLGKK